MSDSRRDFVKKVIGISVGVIIAGKLELKELAPFPEHEDANNTLRTPQGIHNVRDYGAFGDGIHDDTTAIRLATEAANITGGIILFPAGTYIYDPR